MNSTTDGKPGDVTIVNGVTYVFSGRNWMPYPSAAVDLISEATAHGWGFDDGLPPRIDNEGCVFVRILLGRERGPNAHRLTEPFASPGIQFHITWRAPHPVNESKRSSWIMGPIYRKTTDNDWHQVRFLKSVRSDIVTEPVILPSLLIPANA